MRDATCCSVHFAIVTGYKYIFAFYSFFFCSSAINCFIWIDKSNKVAAVKSGGNKYLIFCHLQFCPVSIMLVIVYPWILLYSLHNAPRYSRFFFLFGRIHSCCVCRPIGISGLLCATACSCCSCAHNRNSNKHSFHFTGVFGECTHGWVDWAHKLTFHRSCQKRLLKIPRLAASAILSATWELNVFRKRCM